MIRIFVMAFILTIMIPSFSYSYDLYVHSVKAPIYKTPSIGSPKIIELKKGTKVTGIKEKANWHHVRYRGKTGWVYKLMVRKSPPVESKKLFVRLKSLFQRTHVLKDKSRRRPSSYATVAAARGLRDKRKRVSDKYLYDYKAIEKMESIEISNDEALKFLTQGVTYEENH